MCGTDSMFMNPESATFYENLKKQQGENGFPLSTSTSEIPANGHTEH